MNFKESVEYLYGLGYELSVKKFGLENTFTLLEAVGNPEQNFLKVQVAGTNGKGSTCAFLKAILLQAGIKVGLNTSPHLILITERIRVNGVDISEEKFAEYVTKLRKVAEKLVADGKLQALPTFFEHITVIAQMIFADENIEIAILETGLGGRFDATTATNAEIVAITPIDFDHQDILGDTIKQIANEKAFIIRNDTDVVISEQNNDAMRVILEKIQKENADAKFAKSVFIEKNEGKTTFRTEDFVYENVKLGLLGEHQIQNAKTAILLAETLQEKGFPITPKNIKDGLESAKHKGRLEFSDGILFDGSHNVAGAKVLRNYLIENVKQPITMIFGVMKGKDIAEIAETLFPLADKLILTKPKNPRSMEIEELRQVVPQSFSDESLYLIEETADALKMAKEIIGENGLILITGSLYLIGEIQGFLKSKTSKV